jgi:hypothetical protein
MKNSPPETPVKSATAGAEQLLRRLEWTVLRRLDGLLQGDYRTLLRGTGMDLADLREYQHHDDVRHIDWNVTARLEIPHVRVFTEDREMSAWFLLDLSPSMDFGSSEQRKRNVSADFVAVLARMLTRHGNRVGAMLYGSGVDAVIPARGGRNHVLHLLHTLQARPEATTWAPPACTSCSNPPPTWCAGAPPCLWCPTSSPNPAGRNPWANSPAATKSSPCACSTRWSWTCPTWA